MEYSQGIPCLCKSKWKFLLWRGPYGEHGGCAESCRYCLTYTEPRKHGRNVGLRRAQRRRLRKFAEVLGRGTHAPLKEVMNRLENARPERLTYGDHESKKFRDEGCQMNIMCIRDILPRAPEKKTHTICRAVEKSIWSGFLPLILESSTTWYHAEGKDKESHTRRVCVDNTQP